MLPTNDALLQSREKLWRTILEALPIAVGLIDLDGNFQELNAKGRELFGPIMTATSPARRGAAIQRALREGQPTGPRELTVPWPDGTNRVLLGELLPMREADGAIAGAVGIVSDITERKRADAKLRDSQMRLKRIFDHEPECVKVLSPDARLLEINPAGLAMVEADSLDLVTGQPVLALVHPDDRRAYAASHRSVIRGGHTTIEFRLLGLKGGMRWLEQHAVPLPSGEESGPPYVLSVTRDITERKALEAQLQQAQRLESVGRLAGGIAHDFNNLLTVIIGCAELVLGVNNGGEATGKWEETLAAAHRAAELTSRLLAFARQQPILPRVVDLNAVVRGLDGLLRRVIGEHVRLAVDLHSAPLPVNIDPGQFEQIIVNLAVNARDAMPSGGAVQVSTNRRVVSDSEARHHVGLRAGDTAELSVSDTGVGIPASLRERLFEPFFTTKGPGRGTGLGLSMCYGIVRQAGGSVGVDSTVGVGTRVTVSLPVVAGAITTAGPQARPVGAVDGAHSLVVEDEHGVAELTRRALEFGGYRVTLARNGVEALDVLEEQRDSIALLLTDVVMPDMRGTTLAQQVLEEDPSMRVVFMSGYPGSLDKEFPGARLLHKPFTPADLLRHIAEALRQS